jgi:D-alanine-D-alanine ligase
VHIGIAFDLRSESHVEGKPDDWQEELDSPKTINALSRSIIDLGHRVTLLGNGPAFVSKLIETTDPVDMVFNIAEGTVPSRSREALVPAVCQLLGIPCTGSDPSALGLALDKAWTKRVVQGAGVPVPKGITLAPGRKAPDLETLKTHGLHSFPMLVKPAWEGSSKGIRTRSLVKNPLELEAAIAECQGMYGQPAMVEEFIEGDEVTVGLLGPGDPWIGVMRILPKKPTSSFVYSLEVKRNWQEMVRYESPAQFPPATIERIKTLAKRVWNELGLRDISRMDFRIREGEPVFLEVNPLPGLDPITGDLCILSKGHGLSHADILRRVISSCAGRHGLANSGQGAGV